MYKVLDPFDIEDIKIIKVYWKDSNFVKDVILRFPEKYGFGDISFLEHGLINVNAEGIEYTEDSTEHCPKVKFEFYGILEEEVENTEEN